MGYIYATVLALMVLAPSAIVVVMIIKLFGQKKAEERDVEAQSPEEKSKKNCFPKYGRKFLKWLRKQAFRMGGGTQL